MALVQEIETERPRGFTAGRLEELYERHAQAAVRLGYLLTGDRELARDLVQDAFVKLARRLVHIRQPASFEWYLRRTMVNLAISNARRVKAERARVERVARMSPMASSLGEHTVEAREDLRRALLRLPERQRAAVVLRFYEDLSVEQTAEVMGCPTGTVKSLVSRAMDALRLEVSR
jgi:RNA polymerase sigma-70 factor (sigma-E family)